MREIVSFLNQVQENNNRTWFAEHKTEYQKIQKRFNEFVERLLVGISEFDKEIAGVTLQQSIYRFYRDTRFSPDKRPYKNHIGAYICPFGKKSGFAGYYFHVEADNGDYIGDNILAAGIYCPEKRVLASIRDDIYANAAPYRSAIAKAKGFTVDYTSALKRLPKGFPVDASDSDLLKLKNFTLNLSISKEILFGKDLYEFVIEKFKTTHDYNLLLNRAVEFARDEQADLSFYQ